MFATPSFSAAPTYLCLGPGIGQNSLYLKRGCGGCIPPTVLFWSYLREFMYWYFSRQASLLTKLDFEKVVRKISSPAMIMRRFRLFALPIKSFLSPYFYTSCIRSPSWSNSQFKENISLSRYDCIFGDYDATH